MVGHPARKRVEERGEVGLVEDASIMNALRGVDGVAFGDWIEGAAVRTGS